MEAKSSFLHVFEKLESFVGKLPGSVQKPILQEVTPLKDLFLRQRAPRIVLSGDPAASSAGLFNAIFTAPVAPFAPPDADVVQAALTTEPPDLFLFLTDFSTDPQAPANLSSDLDRLESLLDLTGRVYQTHPCVVGLVVNSSEQELRQPEMDAARARLQMAMVSRPKIAQHMAPALDVATFMRFRMDGSFDADSDRRFHINELVHVLVAELPNEARLEMARLSGAKEAQAKIAQTLVKSLAAISAALGAQPIPLADLPFLITFQLAMVAGIIHISGRELSFKLATEFLGTMGVNVGMGLVLREGARAAIRAAAKLLLPGVGNAISGFVAASGTYAIGRAATAYYIEGVNLAEARKLFKRSQRPDHGVFRLLNRRKELPGPAEK